MRFVTCGRSSPCIGERPQPVAHRRVEHLARVREPGRGVDALHDRAARRRRARRCRRGSRGARARFAKARLVVVDDHVVVVQVRDRTAAVAVQAERERADHERLEVVHEVAADEARRVARSRSAAAAAASPTRRPRRSRRARSPRARCRRRRGSARRARCVPVGVEQHALDVRLGPDLAAAGAQRVAQRRDRIALGVDRAAEERRRTRSCCTRAGRRRAPSSRRSARGTGGSRAACAASVVSTAPNMSAPGGIGYAPARHSANGFAPASPGDADEPLGLARSTAPSRRSRPASRRCRRPRSARARSAALKSTARKRGSLPSAWKPPPPTVDGRLLTSPANRRSPSSSSRR